MPVQLIDLKSFIRNQISVDTVDRRTTLAGDLGAGADGFNVSDMPSIVPTQIDNIVNDSGTQYSVVGYSVVGDGSVVAP